jgi:hypothetical protein
MIPFSRTYKNLSTTYKDRSEFSHSLSVSLTESAGAASVGYLYR